MTSSFPRGRPRRGRSQISVRVVHALAGGLVAVMWLTLPGTAVDGGVGGGADRPVAGAVGQEEDEGNGGNAAVDLVLPVAALVATGVLAGYGFFRRRRRARGRTTPGGAAAQAGEPPVGELDERARAALVEADDWLRVSTEELGFVTERFGAQDAARIEPFTRVLRDAEAELAVAFRMRWQYEAGVPEEAAARRHALAGVVGRCEEAGRLLDGQAAAFDQTRALEEGLGGGLGHALVVAEGRFRELTARTGGAGKLLGELGERYGPAATAAVAGHVEQAKDRLVFATTRLNHARQLADSGEVGRSAAQLRAAEGATAQAAVLIDGVERLAEALATATAMVPAALTGGEMEIAGARELLRGFDAGLRATEGAEPAGELDAPGTAGDSGPPRSPGSPGPPESPGAVDVPPGELRARVVHADLALSRVREELTSGRPYDPLGLLRHIVRAVAPLAAGRAGVLPAAAAVCAHSAVAGADGVVATHRAAVGCAARTHLAEARRLLGTPADGSAGRGARRVLADLVVADTLAQQAHDLAEQDIRAHGHPIDIPGADISGLTGAVLGGVMLGQEPDGGPPVSFGGSRSRGRRGDQGRT